jgi:hypothetical protein
MPVVPNLPCALDLRFVAGRSELGQASSLPYHCMPRFVRICSVHCALWAALALALRAATGQEAQADSLVLPEPPCCYHIGGLARAYYLNDQRIEFTGLEETFAVEGVLDGGVHQQLGDWLFQVEGELFFTQPYDRNVLVDDPVRASFAHNFEIDAVTISQLYLAASHGDWRFTAGRFVTPFGRFYFTNYRNNFDDSPFIRSEAILFRETGLLAEWSPGIWNLAAALTNGGPNQDANSSKALVARVGIDADQFVCGASVKVQDGIGSEGQKQYNEHFGLDAMIARGRWTLSGEVILDHYGFRRPGFDPNDITWGRSIYFRDLNDDLLEPISGVGYYLNLGYEGPAWSMAANYGEFYPEELGVPEHDTPTRRGILKVSRHWTEHLETYGAMMIENTLEDAFVGHDRRGIYVLAGCQFSM